ncbi:GNAT family N-acetyltransferase [Aeromonas veronii]|uniref:GNAT family N-acetyltransferase n=1 Tax=Aeromonas veronii TaxID=654 RepID=UPI0029D5E8F0|nr:GNAT family N-acetyltransferase [Aeromonas veronii]MDX7876775.1 GNAT family N-acetyltransferase [Aeromonas veronii]
MNNRETAEIAFKAFQKALSENLIKTDNGKIHNDLKVYMDKPQGQVRFTYALMATGTRIKSSCVAVITDPYKGKPCFDIGVTTLAKFRGKGFAKEVLNKSIDEMKHGFGRNGISEFYLELKVDKHNVASHKLCEKIADEVIDNDISTTYMKLAK